MESNLHKYTIWVGVLLLATPLLAQKSFDLQLAKTTFEAGSLSVRGYETTFDFDSAEVRKGWWRYARSFGQTTDMRSHYEVVIPASATDGNVAITIYSVTEERKSGSTMKLGIQEEKYLIQVEELLREFKRDFYVKHYLALLAKKEEETAALTKSYQSATLEESKSELLSKIAAKRREIDEIKEWLKGVGG